MSLLITPCGDCILVSKTERPEMTADVARAENNKQSQTKQGIGGRHFIPLHLEEPGAVAESVERRCRVREIRSSVLSQVKSGWGDSLLVKALGRLSWGQGMNPSHCHTV